MKKRVVSIFIIMVMILSCISILPAQRVKAVTTSYDITQGNITISAGTTLGFKVSYGSGQVDDDISSTQPITITDSIPGNPSTNYVKLDPNLGTLNITLENVNINTNYACPFLIGSGTTVNLTLSGANTLNGGTSSNAGLGVPSGATLHITADSTDSLMATSGSGTGSGGGSSAGIGGGAGTGFNNDGNCGTVTIDGGIITATGGHGASGIGGGDYGSGGTVIISGGTVTAIGGYYGAGIGGGFGGKSGTITINGGIVKATGGNTASGIGGGVIGTGEKITITGGTVTATGGSGDSITGGGSGIGGGGGTAIGGSGGIVIINAGTVTATGGSSGGYYSTDGGSGIGSGGGSFASGSSGTLTVNGGSLKASSIQPAVQSSGGSSLSLVTIAGMPVSASVSYTVNGGSSVNCSTDASGNLYLWLPQTTGSATDEIQITITSSGVKYGSNIQVGLSNNNVTPNQEQAAPTGLTGIAPTTAANNDGKITGVSDSMEYRLQGVTSFTSVTASATEITGLAAGTYQVRYAAKTGFNAGDTVDVEVPTYTPPTTYNVNIGTLTGGSITATPTTSTSGSAISLAITPDVGKQLQAGSLKYNDGSDHLITGNSFTMPAANVTISAVFEVVPPNIYTINTGTLTGGTITATPTTSTSGSAISLAITPDVGKQLQAGSLKYNDGSDHLITGNSFTMPAANVTISAVFEVVPPNIYTINTGTLTGGTITATPTTATYGSAISLAITPDVGKQLQAGSLKYNDGSDHLITGNSFTMPAANVTISAVFEVVPPNIYTINTGTLTGGTITATPTATTSGSAVSLAITPDAGKQLQAGSLKYNDGSDHLITGTSFNMPAANVTISAVFEAIPPNTYTINIGTLTGGTITATPTTSTSGSAISLAITPDVGKQLQAGSLKYNDGSDHLITGTSFTMPAANVTIYAVFEAIPSTTITGSSSSSSRSTVTSTIQANLIDEKTGQSVEAISVQVTIEADGTKTVTMKASDAIVVREPNGNKSSLTDFSKLGFSTPVITIGTESVGVTITSDGTIVVKGLANNTETQFDITYDLGNGKTCIIGYIKVKVDSTGVVSLTIALIDPYGTITDEATGKAIAGVNVTLYYANTDRNKAAGKTPDTVVVLPGIDGFKPNNNKNPQISDVSGAYGFMVFPVSDYYIVGTKDGYMNYTSPTISVEQEIVKWNFTMHINGTERLAGQSRVDTSLAIAKATYSNTLSNVILATSENYPDALSGSVLAYKLNAPILLVGNSSEDQQKVLDYLKSNLDETGKVYILGGSTVVSTDIEAKITALGFKNITRLAGADRYETAAKIADTIGIKEGTPIVLVSGENYADALSVSSIAAVNQYPILIVSKAGISDSVKKEISTINPSKVFIIGAQGVVSSAVEAEVSQIAAIDKTNVVRIGGTDRFDTSLLVAKYFNLTGKLTCVATGNDFPDALAGSIYAAKNNAHIILVDKALTDSETTYLQNEKILGTTIFGGEGSVSKVIEQQLNQIMGQ